MDSAKLTKAQRDLWNEVAAFDAPSCSYAPEELNAEEMLAYQALHAADLMQISHVPGYGRRVWFTPAGRAALQLPEVNHG